jgi:hypothetical protein
MAKNNVEERLESIQERKEKLLKQERELKQKLKQRERKERTKRLVQTGAIFEKYFDCHSVEEAEQIARQFADYVKEKKVTKDDYILIKNRESDQTYESGQHQPV